MTDKEILQLLLQKMTSFEEKIEIMQSDILSLKDGQELLKGDIRNLHEGQESLKSEVTCLQVDVKGLIEGQKELLRGQEIIKDQVVKNSEDISQLATKSDLDKLNKRLDYQYIRIGKVEENIHFIEVSK